MLGRAGLWGYKVRTLLAVLGIAISSLLVIFLVAVLYNFKASLVGQIKDVGLQQIVVVPRQMLNTRAMDVDISSMLSFTSVSSTLTDKDARDVREKVPGIVAAAPQIETITRVSIPEAPDAEPIDSLFTGTYPEYTDIFTLELEEGEFYPLKMLKMKRLLWSWVRWRNKICLDRNKQWVGR